MSRAGPDPATAAETVRAHLTAAGLEHEEPRPGTFVAVLPGERKLRTTVSLVVGDHGLGVNAFVVRRPDENHEAVYRWLLERNRRTAMVAYSLDHLGDVYQALNRTDEAKKNWTKALELAKGRVVDVVITDVNMPNMDGIELIRQLRTLPKYKFTPMLLLTTESGADKKAAGKAAGATGWLVKPFNPEQLLATIAKVLG